jgi:hypothetical protein
MLLFVETRETAYGVDLDYILDFIEYCNHGKAAMGCWPAMAERWIQQSGAKVSVDNLAHASRKFVQEQGSRLKEGTTFYTLEGALDTFKRFKDFEDFAMDKCGGDDQLGDTLFNVGERIEELIKIRNTREFSHVVSDAHVDLPDGEYKAVWNGYTIMFENGFEIEVGPYGENLDKVRKSMERPESITVWVWNGIVHVYGYDI